jgi:hypothetical protein
MTLFEEFEQLITTEALRLDIYPEEIKIGYNFKEGWIIESSFFESEEIEKLKQFVKENESKYSKRQSSETDIEKDNSSKRMGYIGVSYGSWKK